MNRPKWLVDIPSDEYHAATKRNEYTTSHRLNLFRKCPALYKKTIDGAIVEGDTAAFMLGRATHAYILENRKFTNEYTISDGPVNEKTGKPYGKTTSAYAEWAKAQDKFVVSTAERELMDRMLWAICDHPTARNLVYAGSDFSANGIAEGTVRAVWNGEPVQARIDLYNPETNAVIDLKTCADIDRFRYDVRDYGYVEQMAFYAHLVELCTNKTPTAYLVAVEKKEPYRVAVVQICDITLNDANHNHMGGETWHDDNDAMISELQYCRNTNSWPTRYERIITI